jgi:hypothetical protein
VTPARLVLVSLAIALVAPASASAAWLPIEDVGGIKFTGSEMTFAGNGRGDAVILWKDDRGAQVAVSRRAGAFGRARRVPGTAGQSLDTAFEVLLNEDGRALIHWRHFNTANRTQRAYVVGLKVDGGFGKARAVTPAAEYLFFNPAVGPGGRFAFTYAVGNGEVYPPKPTYSRSAPPSGRLGPRRRIATGAITVREVWYAGTRPYIAFTRSADKDTKLFERRIDPPASARQIATVQRLGVLALETAPNGTQVALWIRDDTHLFAAVRRTGQAFRAQEIDNRLPPQELDVAVAPSGAALVAWQDFYESTIEDEPPPSGQEDPGRIVMSYRAPGGSFAAPRAFRADPQPTNIFGLNADIESDGLAVLGFSAYRNAGTNGRSYVALIDEGGDPDFTPIGELGDTAGAALVTIDERARTAATWRDERDVLAMRGDFGR